MNDDLVSESFLSSGLVSFWAEHQTGYAGYKSSLQHKREEDVTPKNSKL